MAGRFHVDGVVPRFTEDSRFKESSENGRLYPERQLRGPPEPLVYLKMFFPPCSVLTYFAKFYLRSPSGLFAQTTERNAIVSPSGHS